MSSTVITPSNGNNVYKRRDRGVSPETAQKISYSLKTYYATHPRGKAENGSEWSKKISASLKNNYWTRIPRKQTYPQQNNL